MLGDVCRKEIALSELKTSTHTRTLVTGNNGDATTNAQEKDMQGWRGKEMGER